MTAVVGILNRQGIAIAADSAATNSNSKITNGALKIFTISKYHPVGVMLYNSSAFMVTPWETVIKMYRKQLGDASFPSVADYQADFIKYLHSQNFFIDNPAFLEDYLKGCFWRLANSVYNEAAKGGGIVNTANVLKIVEAWIKSWVDFPSVCSEFGDFTVSELDSGYRIQIKEVCDERLGNEGVLVDKNFLDRFTLLLFQLIKSKEEFFVHTGLVFVGYGDAEIYPALVPIKVAFPINKRLKYWVEDSRVVKISNMMGSTIAPFAQTETMSTILSGVSPELETIYSQSFTTFLGKYKSQILGLVDAKNVDLIAKINKLDVKEIHDNYLAEIGNAKNEKYIYPLHNAVENLSKEDLAEMAESLIYLTYLQKRITLAAEDVGGHVDVAVISKGDGFIWIKRKHYFDQELNRHFMSNYFRK